MDLPFWLPNRVPAPGNDVGGGGRWTCATCGFLEGWDDENVFGGTCGTFSACDLIADDFWVVLDLDLVLVPKLKGLFGCKCCGDTGGNGRSFSVSATLVSISSTYVDEVGPSDSDSTGRSIADNSETSASFLLSPGYSFIKQNKKNSEQMHQIINWVEVFQWIL